MKVTFLNENIPAKDLVKIYLKNKSKGNSNTLLLVIINLYHRLCFTSIPRASGREPLGYKKHLCIWI